MELYLQYIQIAYSNLKIRFTFFLIYYNSHYYNSHYYNIIVKKNMQKRRNVIKFLIINEITKTIIFVNI